MPRRTTPRTRVPIKIRLSPLILILWTDTVATTTKPTVRDQRSRVLVKATGEISRKTERVRPKNLSVRQMRKVKQRLKKLQLASLLLSTTKTDNRLKTNLKSMRPRLRSPLSNSPRSSVPLPSSRLSNSNRSTTRESARRRIVWTSTTRLPSTVKMPTF